MRRKGLGLFAGLLLMLAVASSYGLYRLVHSEVALVWVVAQVQRLMLPQLEIQGLQGTFWKGIRADHALWTGTGVKVELQAIEAPWRWSCFLTVRLCLAQARVGDLLVEVAKGPDDDDHDLPVLPLPFLMSWDQLWVERLRVVYGEVTVTFDHIDAAGYWFGHGIELGRVDLDYLGGHISGEAGIRFIDDYPIHGRLHLRHAYGEADADVEGDLARLTGRLAFTAPLPVDASTELFLRDNFHFNAQLLLRETWSVAALTLVGAGASLEGDSDGLSADFNAGMDSPAYLAGMGAVQGRMTWDFDQTRLHFPTWSAYLPPVQSTVATGPVTEAKGVGELAWGTGLELGLRGRVSGVDPGRWWPELPGAMGGDVDLRLVWREARQHLVLALTGLEGQWLGAPVSGTGRADWSPQSGWRLGQGQLAMGNNQVRLITPENPKRKRQKVQAELNLPDLQPLARALGLPLDGGISGVLTLPEGRASMPSEATLVANGLRYGDWQLSSSALAWRAPDEISSSRLDVFGLSKSGQALGDVSVVLEGNGYLQANVDWQTPGVGQVHLRCQLAAPVSGQAPLARNMTASCPELVWAPPEAWQWPVWRNAEHVPLSWISARQQLHIGASCLQASPARLCTSGDSLVGANLAQVDLRLERLPLVWFQPWMPSAEARLGGELAGEARVRRQDGGGLVWQAEVHGQDSVLHVVPQGQPMQIPLREFTAQARAEAGVVSMTAYADAVALGNMRLAMQADSQRQLTGQLQVEDMELPVLQPFTDGLRLIQGKVQGRLELGGSLDQPALRGSVDIRDGEAAHDALPWPIRELMGHLDFTDYQARMVATARLNSSQARLDGDLAWRDTLSGQFRLQSETLHITPLARTDVWLQPDIRLTLAGNRIDIGGKVTVPRAYVILKQLPENAVSVSDDVLVVQKEEEAKSDWDVHSHVDLVLGKEVSFRGFGLESKMRGHLTISHSGQRDLQGNGSIQLKEGRYKAYGQLLKIRTGDLVFVGPLNDPVIRVDAIREDVPDPYVVGVRAEGQLQHPDVSLFSTPAMSERARMYYLLTGLPPESESQVSSAIFNQALLSYGVDKSEDVVANVAGKIGVQDVQFAAVQGTERTGMQVSAYLHPRLFVRYGMNAFDNVNEVTMRYRLRDNLFVEAVSGLANALDLLWTFEHNSKERKSKDAADSAAASAAEHRREGAEADSRSGEKP